MCTVQVLLSMDENLYLSLYKQHVVALTIYWAYQSTLVTWATMRFILYSKDVACHAVLSDGWDSANPVLLQFSNRFSNIPICLLTFLTKIEEFETDWSGTRKGPAHEAILKWCPPCHEYQQLTRYPTKVTKFHRLLLYMQEGFSIEAKRLERFIDSQSYLIHDDACLQERLPAKVKRKIQDLLVLLVGANNRYR